MTAHAVASGVSTVRTPSPLDAAGRDQPIPLTRLIGVELRKAHDTRAGQWLLGAIGGGAALVMVIMIIVGLIQDSGYELKDLVQFANFAPLGLLLPMLGLLSVTGEWSQRTNVVTFTLEPRRQRVVLAKLASGVTMSILASVAAFVTATVSLGAFDLLGGNATWHVSLNMVGAFALLHLINVLTGFAFGMLILNTPAAIVAYFASTIVLPTLFEIAASRYGWAKSTQPWVDFNYAQEPLTEATLRGINWANFAVTALVWFVVPVVAGARRLVRAEIK